MQEHGTDTQESQPDPLAHFHPPVAAWFRDVFPQPTAVQHHAWNAISAGKHALIVAPTGSGKTLAAFLWSLSTIAARAAAQPAAKPAGEGTTVVYISPLKALAVDVERNLTAPLTGIRRLSEQLNYPVPEISVGVRSGDTPAAERAKMLRQPPQILITTPESLYLMLTSKAAGTLRNVHTVIIDEVHAVAGTKRGAHLALSLERLEMFNEQPIQRIGLSATVNPIDEVAAFIGGDRPVEIVNPPSEKRWDVRVKSVVEDFQDPPVDPGLDPPQGPEGDPPQGPEGDPAQGAEGDPAQGQLGDPTKGPEGGPAQGSAAADPALDPAFASAHNPSVIATNQSKSVWPHINKAIHQQILENRSTLVFVNSRRAAEKLTGAINDLEGETLARAHHGSVSKEERKDIEEALKSGALRCVVATSSLELGIDMGLVDHVIQVGAPPSVAAAVQRCGRAGHSVGATSHATIYPLHKQDAEAATVITDRLYRGELEPLHIVRNALDVLAQHTIAAATHKLNIQDWWNAVRRAHPYTNLHPDAFQAVLGLISGQYPSTDFADLKPRVIWDQQAETLEARPGTQHIAVTNGGTIPDRGLYGVFLPAGNETSGEAASNNQRIHGGRRVGELDEEMVYESRVGDVFTLGASNWKILEINRDQVIVTPANGQPAKLPFWLGDEPARPIELGTAIGEHRRNWGTNNTHDLRNAEYIDDNTRRNLDEYYNRQRQETGTLPDEKTIVIEKFQDEVGDWRIIIHTPYGRSITSPWAMSLNAQINEHHGLDALAVAGEDGIVLRVPYMTQPPGADLLETNTDTIRADIHTNVGSSALFAGRFRECAARALLLPRKNPGKRQPLWQQRQRAGQLLDVARRHPDFPIMVEAMRECLDDVYNVPALEQLINSGLRIVEVTTNTPSAFAESILFTYTGAFMYGEDTADRAATLAVDPILLAKVLGISDIGIAIDPGVVADITAAAQWQADGRRARTIEQIIDMLRLLGPLTPAAIADRIDPDERDTLMETLQTDAAGLFPTRLISVHFAGAEHWAITEDARLLRDGLGVPLPPGVAADPTTIDDAFEQLTRRWLRTRGPVCARDLATIFGVGVGIAAGMLARLLNEQYVERIEWDGAGAGAGAGAVPWFVESRMLRRLRGATVAAARGAIQPITQDDYAAYLQQWHGIGMLEREDLQSVLEQLAGVPLSASALETLVLPARIANYQPSDLDQLLSSGAFRVLGGGPAGTSDTWVTFYPADRSLPNPAASAGAGVAAGSGAAGASDLAAERLAACSPTAQALAHHMAGGGAYLASELAAALAGAAGQSATNAPTSGHHAHTGAPEAAEITRAIWELYDAGLITPDSFTPIRTRNHSAGRTSAGRNAAGRNAAGRTSAGRNAAGRNTAGQTHAGRNTAGQTYAGQTHAGPPQTMRVRRRLFTTGTPLESLRASSTYAQIPGRWSLAVNLTDKQLSPYDLQNNDATPSPTQPGEGLLNGMASSSEAGTGTAEREAAALGEAWFDRYAVVTRGAITAEKHQGGFAAAYRLLSAWEDTGAIMRGYIIEGLGGAQFAPRDIIDGLRTYNSHHDTDDTQTCILAATDPANPYGAAIPWPETPEGAGTIARSANAWVILDRGQLIAWVGARGKTIVLFGSADVAHAALQATIQSGRIPPLKIEKINGQPVLQTNASEWIAAGARLTPTGLRIG